MMELAGAVAESCFLWGLSGQAFLVVLSGWRCGRDGWNGYSKTAETANRLK